MRGDALGACAAGEVLALLAARITSAAFFVIFEQVVCISKLTLRIIYCIVLMIKLY